MLKTLNDYSGLLTLFASIFGGVIIFIFTYVAIPAYDYFDTQTKHIQTLTDCCNSTRKKVELIDSVSFIFFNNISIGKYKNIKDIKLDAQEFIKIREQILKN